MSAGSTIEWTETTWNPVLGCTKVSPGCTHCYAERMSNRLRAMGLADAAAGRRAGRKLHYAGVVDDAGRWNNEIVLAFDALRDPYGWRRPRVVFVNSMSDLFHERVPLSFVRRVFEVMNGCPEHTFQVLTKRPERAAAVCERLVWSENIWLGTSVESADYLDRIDVLRAIPAQTRFLSLEPLIGPLENLNLAGIHWAIVGGESGPGARPMDASWVRSIRDQCTHARVPFFFKQWGGVNKKKAGRNLDGQIWNEMPGGSAIKSEPEVVVR